MIFLPAVSIAFSRDEQRTVIAYLVSLTGVNMSPYVGELSNYPTKVVKLPK